MAVRKKVSPVRYALLCRDCVEGMRAMKAAGVGLVVTSPPYNIGIDYASYDDTMARPDYLEWCRGWMREVFRVLKDDGSFFLNVSGSLKEPLFPHQMAFLAVECGWKIQNTFHWVKSISVPAPEGGILSVGHFKPVNSNRFVNDCHEYVFHLTKTGAVPIERLALGVPYQDKSNVTRWATNGSGRDKRCRGNVWFIPYKTIQNSAKDRPHPASFPEELVENCLKIAGATSGTAVMDPFLGIGTSALAAKKFGIRRFTGFEIDKEYLAVAKKALKGCRKARA